MPRLIDADETKKNIEQAFLQHRLGTFTIGDVCDCIDKQPTIDAEPVVHGHWIQGFDHEHLIGWCRCSACDRGIMKDNLGRWPKTRYCPNCGAKMDEDKCET